MKRIIKENANVDDVVNDCASSIHMKKEVYDGSEPVNEGVTKDDDNVSNMSLLYEDILLKWKYLSPKRMMLKEALTFEDGAQLLEEVIVKGNESFERALICVDVLSNNMVEHVVLV